LVLPGQGTVMASSDGTITFLPDAGFAGTATISYTVSDVNGNISNVAEIQITIKSSLPEGTTVPNAFSPNGDGENDVFIIEGAEQYQVSLHVYNRWGNIVYASDNYENTWSGFSMNVQDSRNPSRISVSKEQSELPDGTYFYFIEFAGADAKRYSGFVELRR
jgi:gliding motility-associated-like protein